MSSSPDPAELFEHLDLRPPDLDFTASWVDLLPVVGGFVLAIVLSPLVPQFQVSTPVWLLVTVLFGIGALIALARGRIVLATSVVLGAVLVAVGWWSPLLHPVFYRVFYEAPGVLQWLLIAGLAAVGGLVAGRRGHGRTAAILGGVAILALLLAVFVAPFLGGWYAGVDMANSVEASVEDVDTLPETNRSSVRILPETVGRQYAQNSLQFPRHRLGEGDVTFFEDAHWSYPLEPDGLVNRVIGQQAGAVFVNMTTTRKDVEVVEQSFQCGVGQSITDNVVWNLKQEEYAVSYGTPFVVRHEGDLYLATPYTKHVHKFRATPLPQVYSVPAFGGVALVDTECNVQHLSPEEARASPVLARQNFYPYDLARYKVQSMAYANGIWNKLFIHEDQPQLADLPGEDNQQPFTILTEDRGPAYLLAVEPWGEAAGVYQLWTFDARSGAMERVKLPMNSSLLGPRKAVNYVKKANPKVNWGSMTPSEPIPLVRNGTLFWEVRVVPDSSAGVAYTAFVDAESGDVYRYANDRQIYAFVRGETGVPDRPADRGDGPGSGIGGEASMVVVIVDEDGTPVRTVPVGPNQSIEVRSGNASQAGTAGT